VRWKEDGAIPIHFFEEEDLLQGYFFEIITPPGGVLTFGTFWPPAKDGMLASSLWLTHEIKEKTWGWLTWKAKGKRPDSQFDCSSSSSDDEDEEGSGMSPWRMKLGRHGVTSQGKGKSPT